MGNNKGIIENMGLFINLNVYTAILNWNRKPATQSYVVMQ